MRPTWRVKLIGVFLIVITSILSSVIVSSAGLAGSDKPKVKELEDALGMELNNGLTLRKFEAEVLENLGNKVEPLWGSRFYAVVKTAKDLYVIDSKDSSTKFIKVKTSKGNKIEMYGKIYSTIYQGKWKNRFELEGSPLKGIGFTREGISGKTILKGSDEEKEYWAEKRRKEEEAIAERERAEAEAIAERERTETEAIAEGERKKEERKRTEVKRVLRKYESMEKASKGKKQLPEGKRKGTISLDPFRSALLMDADTGKTLFDYYGDTIAYPASLLKLMVLYVILDQVEQGALRLDDMVQVTKRAARMGGSQVYLDPKEQFSVEDLLYALVIQSANDAAVALAIHVAGSEDDFVAQMNQKAAELGMKNSMFYSVHGLPANRGSNRQQNQDKSTARDLAILARELAKNPKVFKYTGTRERDFRGRNFVMRTHNKLLSNVNGCDGFKTGYFKAAGFSIIATAKRNDVRIIAVVLGSVDRKVRDAEASQMLDFGFATVASSQ